MPGLDNPEFVAALRELALGELMTVRSIQAALAASTRIESAIATPHCGLLSPVAVAMVDVLVDIAMNPEVPTWGRWGALDVLEGCFSDTLNGEVQSAFRGAVSKRQKDIELLTRPTSPRWVDRLLRRRHSRLHPLPNEALREAALALQSELRAPIGSGTQPRPQS